MEKKKVNRKAMDLSAFAFRRREKPATSFIVKKERDKNFNEAKAVVQTHSLSEE